MTADKEIYSQFLGHCEIARVPWMGRDTVPLPNPYSCRFESTAVLAELVQRHDVDSLVKSGVVVRSVDGSPRLNDRLDGRGQFVIPLQADDCEQPFDIVLDNGCVSGKRLAASSILADRITKEALQKFDNVLLVTQTLTEAGILQKCGIPAVVSAGLERLQEPYLSHFIRLFHLIPQQQMRSVFHPTSVRKSGPQLVLFLASLNDMSPTCPDSMRAVEAHLRQFALSCDWDCTVIKSWHPQDSFFDKLSFLANNGRSDYIRGLFRSSISRESQNLIPATVPDKTDNSLRDAFAKWVIATGRTNDADLRNQAWEVLNREWDESLIGPLISAAESCAEPVEANLRMALAELLRMLHPLAAKVSEQSRDRSQQGDGYFVPIRKDDELDRLLPVANLVLRISKEVLSWKEKEPQFNLPFPRRT